MLQEKKKGPKAESESGKPKSRKKKVNAIASRLPPLGRKRPLRTSRGEKGKTKDEEGIEKMHKGVYSRLGLSVPEERYLKPREANRFLGEKGKTPVGRGKGGFPGEVRKTRWA